MDFVHRFWGLQPTWVQRRLSSRFGPYLHGRNKGAAGLRSFCAGFLFFLGGGCRKNGYPSMSHSVLISFFLFFPFFFPGDSIRGSDPNRHWTRCWRGHLHGRFCT